MAKKIVIQAQKGGVGKTTTALSLAGAITKIGNENENPFKVLLIDFDGSCNLTQYLGISLDSSCDIEGHLSRICYEGNDPDPFEGIVQHDEGFYILPGSKILNDLANTLSGDTSNVGVLAYYLNMISDSFDFIIIDTMPSYSFLTLTALAAADSVIIPTLPEYGSIYTLDDVFAQIDMVKSSYNENLEILGLLISKADWRYSFTKGVNKLLHEVYPDVNIFNTAIPTRSAVFTAVAIGSTVLAYDKRNGASTAYLNFAKEVLAHYGYTN